MFSNLALHTVLVLDPIFLSAVNAVGYYVLGILLAYVLYPGFYNRDESRALPPFKVLLILAVMQVAIFLFYGKVASMWWPAGITGAEHILAFVGLTLVSLFMNLVGYVFANRLAKNRLVVAEFPGL